MDTDTLLCMLHSRPDRYLWFRERDKTSIHVTGTLSFVWLPQKGCFDEPSVPRTQRQNNLFSSADAWPLLELNWIFHRKTQGLVH